MINNRVYNYVALPFFVRTLGITASQAITDCNILGAGFDCELHTRPRGETYLYLVIEKDDFCFRRLVPVMMRDYHYVDHFDGADSVCVCVFKYPLPDVAAKFINGEYSKMYEGKILNDRLFTTLYQANPVSGLPYNKYYYVITHAEEYFNNFILPILLDVDSLSEEEIASMKDKEWVS